MKIIASRMTSKVINMNIRNSIIPYAVVTACLCAMPVIASEPICLDMRSAESVSKLDHVYLTWQISETPAADTSARWTFKYWAKNGKRRIESVYFIGDKIKKKKCMVYDDQELRSFDDSNKTMTITTSSSDEAKGMTMVWIPSIFIAYAPIMPSFTMTKPFFFRADPLSKGGLKVPAGAFREKDGKLTYEPANSDDAVRREVTFDRTFAPGWMATLNFLTGKGVEKRSEYIIDTIKTVNDRITIPWTGRFIEYHVDPENPAETVAWKWETQQCAFDVDIDDELFTLTTDIAERVWMDGQQMDLK